MDDAILYLSDESALQAWDLNWAKLGSSTTPLNLNALRLCIRLLSSKSVTASRRSIEELKNLVLLRLPKEPQDSEHLYKLAEICSANETFAWSLFHQICLDLDIAATELSVARKENYGQLSAEEYLSQTTTFLTFLKCSFWLPPSSHHYVESGTMKLLTGFVGLEDLTEVALDVISALLSLLSHRHQEPIVVANPGIDMPWVEVDSATYKSNLGQSVIDMSLWTRLKTLDPTYFGTKSSKLFKVWFQWISWQLQTFSTWKAFTKTCIGKECKLAY